MENNALTDHAYDGIQEYDNPLPGWWTYTFIATIVFSVFYTLYFHTGAPGRSVIEQYDVAMTASSRLLMEKIGELKPDEATILKYSVDPSMVRVGAGVFRTHCISCHGRNGEGKVGPNLTDNFYKNIRSVEDVAKVISNGAANGAMPAWANRLQTNEIVLVSSYVLSLRGTEAAGGKGPEGSEIAPWPDPPAAEPETNDSAAETAGEKG